MSTRIGIGVGRDTVRAVVVRQRRIAWVGEAPLASPDELHTAITGLLTLARVPRWPRPILHAAVGPHAAQLKRVVGLPEIARADALAAIVREAAGTYFLRNGIPLLTTGVQLVGPGVVVAGALERPYVEAIRALCAACGYRLGSIVPTPIALTRSLVDASFRWTDGNLTVEVRRTGPSIDTVRTRQALPTDADTMSFTPVAALATLAADSVRYADAFGAAALDAREPVAIRLEGGVRAGIARFVATRRSLDRFGVVVAAGALMLGLSPLSAKWAGSRAQHNVAQIRPGRWKVVTTTIGELERVSAVLSQASAFRDGRTRLSWLLGELARALPDHTVALQFDWFGDRGEVTVLTTDPSAVLTAIRRVPGIGKVELVGPMGRQTAGGKDLQRIVIRFEKVGGER